MGRQKCRKPALPASAPGGETRIAAHAGASKQMDHCAVGELFSVLWILGFCIFCEILLFTAQELAQTFLNMLANTLPSNTAAFITKYLSAALSAFALLLIFAAGICLYSIWNKALRALPVKMVSIALFLLGHTVATALSDGLTALLLLSAGFVLELSGCAAAVAGIILSLLLRIVSETALVSWALRLYERR